MAGKLTLAEARKKPGISMRGGRYPIRNATDLEHAERAVGRTPPAGRPAVEAHIRDRAKALGAPVTRTMPGKKAAQHPVEKGYGMARQRVGR